MFIQCSSCNSKYLVNSADLKPSGRMVECASCGNQWYQKTLSEENLIFPSTPTLKNQTINENKLDELNKYNNLSKNDQIKNLPSTVVNEQKVSILNSFLVVFFLFLIMLIFFIMRSYGVNVLVLIDYYLKEFYFNLNLIILDLAKIIHNIMN